jgi:sensor histidine kinase YesM
MFFFAHDNFHEVDNEIIEKINLRILTPIIPIVIFGLIGPDLIVQIKNKISNSYNWLRLLVEIASINLIATILGLLIYYCILINSNDLVESYYVIILKALFMCFFFGCVIITIYEAWINFYESNELKLSLKSLEKEQLSLKLISLQQKLDPHFMFNSLNVLSELVHDDSGKADTFINQFSKVYRNVLEMNDELVVLLSREIVCLESYLYLLNIRLGDSLKIENSISKELYDLFIPPLSLQLLIENAIKHNVASIEEPLIITLKSKGNMLIVSNNKKLRYNKKIGVGLGLKKLQETYRLLNQSTPLIIDSKDEFTVHLPLIEN